MRRTLRTQVAAHYAILQSRVNAVIIATTQSASILWILWRHTNGLFCLGLKLSSIIYTQSIGDREQKVDLLKPSTSTENNLMLSS